MYSLEINNLSIIPMDFNLFYQTARQYKKNIRYSREYTVSEKFFEELEQYIYDSKKRSIAIDMKNIVSYPSRLFSRMKPYLEQIVFYNVEHGQVKQKLTEDLEDLIWIEETVCCSLDKNREEIGKIVADCIQARKIERDKIVKGITQNTEGKTQFLESSGLYSNCYVNVKKLFSDVDSYYFILYSLAEMLYPYVGKIDAFISTSKNGAILANILGGILNVKEVHLIGLGPKYSMKLGDSIECIKEGKRYTYIFDFMCTGTELKIVSALVNSKKAFLSYAAGIAKYKKDADFDLLEKLIVLADTKELGIDYKIAGDKDDL